MEHSLTHMEQQLQRRWDYQYVWRRKQNNLWDGYTNYIYNTADWDDLISKIAATAATHKLNKHDIFYYAINRWYNFWSAQAVERIFKQQPKVTPVANHKDSDKDFFIDQMPFDHKTSVFPKGFDASFSYAQQHKRELITWLYEHQSAQQRYHLKNRLFIIVYDKGGQHWRLKASLQLLKNGIEKYMSSYNANRLEAFTFVPQTTTYSDIIWVTE